MGYGGNLIISGVVAEINKNLGKKVFLCYSPNLSDILSGNFYDRSRSLKNDEVFNGNPHVVTNSVINKIAAVELLDRLFAKSISVLKLKAVYERFVKILCNIIYSKECFIYLHIDHVANTYIKKQLPNKFIWKDSVNAVSGILQNFGVFSSSQYSELFFSTDEIENFLRKYLNQKLGKTILIEPDSKGEWFGDLRKWDFESWQSLVYRIKKKYRNISVCQIGLSTSKLLNDVVDLRGFTQSFREACLLIKYADLFICTDGGLMHGARAVDTSTIVIWGGINEPKFLGYPDTQIIVHKKVSCAPCGNLGWCDNDKICMRGISIDDVYSAVQEQCSKLGLE